MGRSDCLELLHDLLARCRVAVTGASQGAGFFVAPGYVVTCAHVAGAEPGGQVRVGWDAAEHAGVVLAASPAPRGVKELWPYPDLAVVHVPDAPAVHPCVWLDDLTPRRGAPLTAAGFSAVYEPRDFSGRIAAFTRGGTLLFQDGPMIELVDGEVNSGLSGGPVLNDRSGGVCAVTKASRQTGTDLGGLATPVSALRLLDPDVYRALVRAHDRHHADSEEWTRLSDLITAHDAEDGGADLAPGEDRRLLALMADLPAGAAVPHSAAFVAAAAPGTDPPRHYPQLDHRDVYRDLAAQLRPEPGRLPYELAFAADLVRASARRAWSAADRARVQAMKEEILVTAGRLKVAEPARRRLAAGPGTEGTPSIIARIRHSFRNRSLYHVMAWRYQSPSDIVPVGAESPAMPLDEATRYLAGLLPEQIDLMGGVSKPGLIELIVPREALDEAFADWTLWPEQPWFALGRKHYVVVRPLERHDAPGLHAAWEERWENLEDKPVGESLVCVCGRFGQHQAALGAALDSDPGLSALALAGSPRSGPVADAYQVAVASGIPAMVWRRDTAPCGRGAEDPCVAPGGPVCGGDAFLPAVRAALARTPRDELPRRVRELRNAATAHGGSSHVGRDLVVLWDDPRRRIPHLILTTSEEGPAR
ncbi:trypsin-like peptidase domain-containing protein [Streptomyces sp. NPDC049040]|uniref:VMAP-C domain-containing protein n=1 Tax=Streptomyces sp. NPDC049040 TaxID=3365593 RepID=UPI00371D7277